MTIKLNLYAMFLKFVCHLNMPNKYKKCRTKVKFS